MKKTYFPFITSLSEIVGVMSIVLIAQSCNPPLEEAFVDTSEKIAENNEKPKESVTEKTEVKRVVSTTTTNQYYNTKTETDTENVTHITYEVLPKVVDSVSTIIPLYDTTEYNKMAVSYFSSLSNATNGKTYFANNPDSMMNVVMEILTTQLEDGTDIVFLIDKTGSMQDDLDKVQNSMKMMMNYLKKFNNVKIGIVAYGDKNWHYDMWYNSIDLSYDIDRIEGFMKGFTTIGNPDVAESVNDAIVKTVEEMSWTPGNKRLMLVIGDAPSQAPPLSNYSLQQVIEKCDSMNVKFNLYPIIISTHPLSMVDVVVDKNFVKTYPNPVSSTLNVEFKNFGNNFNYMLNDISGRLIKSGELKGMRTTLAFDDIPDGTYLIQIFNYKGDSYYTKQLLVQH